MRQITLPLVLPAIVAGGLLAFIGALANFGIPALLRMRARFFVLTTSIYYALAIPDFGLATALSSMLVLVALASMALQFGIQRGESRFTVISGKAVHPSELKLRSLRHPLFFATSFFVVFISILPILSMVLTASMRYWGAPITAANLTLQNFNYVLRFEAAQRAIMNSLFLGAVAATVAMFVGTVSRICTSRQN